MATPSAPSQPVCIVLHDRLMPGSAIANRLVDRGWKVHTHPGVDGILDRLRHRRPMLLVVQLDLRGGDVCRLIEEMRADVELAHIAVLAYGPVANIRQRDEAIAAGAQVVAADSSILDQLPSLIETALALD